jgi:hypothetical protein
VKEVQEVMLFESVALKWSTDARVLLGVTAVLLDSFNTPHHFHALLLGPNRRVSVAEYPQKMAAFTSHARARVAPAQQRSRETSTKLQQMYRWRQYSAEMSVEAASKRALLSYINMVHGLVALWPHAHSLQPNSQRRGA